MPYVTVLGTGHMGAPIARRLLDTGHAVTVWNRSPSRAAAVNAGRRPGTLDAGSSSGAGVVVAGLPPGAAGAGSSSGAGVVVAGLPPGAAGAESSPRARVAGSPADAVREADVVLVMLTDAAAVGTVLTDAAAGLRAGACVVQMSTIGPHETRAIAATMPAGVSYVDAPVGGSVDAAGSGQLRIFVGGADAAVAGAAAVLESLGTVRRCGPVGAGAATKLVANAALVTALGAVHDALVVADALGVARADAMELLGAGPLAAALPRLTSVTSSFAVALAAKDAHLARRAAPGAGVLAATAALLDSAPSPSADIASVIASVIAPVIALDIPA